MFPPSFQRLMLAIFWVTGITFRSVCAQDLSFLINDGDWYDGEIELTDGTQLSGLVSYNVRKGTVSFRNSEVSGIYNSRKLTSFNFFDSSEKQHFFYSLECDDEITGNNGPFIFEAIREYANFALLLRRDPTEMATVVNTMNSGYANSFGTTTSYVKVTERESLYVVGENIPLICVFDQTFSVTEGRVFERTRKKGDIKKDNLRMYFSDFFSSVSDYAKKNKISFEVMEDLLRLFDYYAEKK